jgi:succinate dehydrogenase hydrophobic anchor subunit
MLISLSMISIFTISSLYLILYFNSIVLSNFIHSYCHTDTQRFITMGSSFIFATFLIIIVGIFVIEKLNILFPSY